MCVKRPTDSSVDHFGDEATTYSLVRQTGEAGNRTQVPWVQGEWIIYPLQLHV